MWRCRGTGIRRLVVTAPCHAMWRCRGTGIRRLVVTATAPRHTPPQPTALLSRSAPSGAHPSRDACSWVSHLFDHTHKRTPGRWPGAAVCRDPGKGWQTTSLRIHSLQLTPRILRIQPTQPITQKRPGERLANDSPSDSLSATHSTNPSNTSHTTNNPKATRGKAGKRLAFGFTLCNSRTQSPNTPTLHV